MIIVEAKVKELVDTGNTVIFLLPSREYMKENIFLVNFTINDPLFHQFCFLLEIVFFHSFTTIIIKV